MTMNPFTIKPRLAVGVRAFVTAMIVCGVVYAGPFPTVPLKELPDPLRSVWKELKPEMTEMSHCAAAFDSHSDGDKMVFRCSIHIKMSAEGERRAMKYCEEKREEKNIKAPCRLVIE